MVEETKYIDYKDIKPENIWLRLLRTVWVSFILTLVYFGGFHIHNIVGWIVAVGCGCYLFYHIWQTYVLARRKAYNAHMEKWVAHQHHKLDTKSL